jgi:hypothetical protein
VTTASCPDADGGLLQLEVQIMGERGAEKLKARNSGGFKRSVPFQKKTVCETKTDEISQIHIRSECFEHSAKYVQPDIQIKSLKFIFDIYLLLLVLIPQLD